MKKILPALVGIAVIGIGAWVFWTRAPIHSEPSGEQALATPSLSSDSAAEVETPVKTEPTPTEKSAFQKIAESLNADDQRKFLILDQILKSKNDNDPRLDTEFKNMSPELKRAMGQYYKIIPPEGRNERGTIAFLYTRSIDKPQDVDFIQNILMEKPCLSLADCSKDAQTPTAEEIHMQGISETTANYPQLTALRQALSQYNLLRGQHPPNTAVTERILQMYRVALESPNEKVREEAQRILKYLRR